MKNALLIIALFLITTSMYSQDNSDLIITDTVYKEELVSKHVYYEHCPGFISGLPCPRYFEYIGNQKMKRKYINVKKEQVYYQLTKEDTLVINFKVMGKDKLFQVLDLLYNDPKSSNIEKCKKHLKWCARNAVYNHVRYYVGKIKRESLNNYLYNNIMVATEEEYVNVYLIYN